MNPSPTSFTPCWQISSFARSARSALVVEFCRGDEVLPVARLILAGGAAASQGELNLSGPAAATIGLAGLNAETTYWLRVTSDRVPARSPHTRHAKLRSAHHRP